MPEGVITTANNPNAIATVVAARTLPRLKGSCVAYQVSDPSYADEVSSFGKTVNVPIPAEYVTNLMMDGGTVTQQAVTLGNAALVLNRHREITFSHTDVNQAFASPNLAQTSLGQAVANMAEAIDADLLGVYALFTATAQGAYNTSITEPTVDGAETELFDQRVPDGIRKSLIVTGTGMSSIRQIPRFTEADKAGPGASSKSDRIVGQIKGFDVYRSQQVPITSSTQRHGLAMTPSALLTAIRRLGKTSMDGTVQVEMMEDSIALRLTGSYRHDILGAQWTLDVLYGFTSGRTTHGVEVKH